VLVWHEVIPGRATYDPSSGVATTTQPTTTRWHAQMLFTDQVNRVVERGHEVTGRTENEAMAKAIMRLEESARPDESGVSPARRAQLDDAQHEVSFAVMAFEAGDLATAKRSIQRAGLLFDGDSCCQYCGGDECEQGVYTVCRRCFWTLRESNPDRTRDDSDEGGAT